MNNNALEATVLERLRKFHSLKVVFLNSIFTDFILFFGKEIVGYKYRNIMEKHSKLCEFCEIY